MNKLIIFDLDGTLMDTRTDLANAVNLARKDYSLPVKTLEEIIEHIGQGKHNLIEKTFSDRPETDIDEAVDKFTDYYSKNLINETVLYEGVAEGLKNLSNRKYFMAVLSNKPGDLCRELTEHFKIDDNFIAVMGGGDTPVLKPEPDAIFNIITRAENMGFKREADNVWMVGDHHTDLRVAENAEIKSIFCNYGFGNRRGLSSNFDIDNFRQVETVTA